MLANLAMYPQIEDSIVRFSLKKFIGLAPVAILNHAEGEIFKHLKEPEFEEVNLFIYLIVSDELRS